MSSNLLRSLAYAPAAVPFIFNVPVQGQQSYVSRYSAYTGFATIDSPVLGLEEKGVHAQFGVNPKSWLSMGIDYSAATRSDALTPNLLLASIQRTIHASENQLKGIGALPPTYVLRLRTDASTQTLGAGPQLAYRHFSHLTLFAHPSLGALREHVVPRPADPFQILLVNQLAPAEYKLTGFRRMASVVVANGLSVAIGRSEHRSREFGTIHSVISSPMVDGLSVTL